VIALLFVDKDYSTLLSAMETQLKIKIKCNHFIKIKMFVPYCWWGLYIGWNICGIVCIDGLTIQPPSALTSAGCDWRYCPYDNGIVVGHNWIFVGIGFGGGGGGDGQVLSISYLIKSVKNSCKKETNLDEKICNHLNHLHL
jgi:hypothetical protein